MFNIGKNLFKKSQQSKNCKKKTQKQKQKNSPENYFCDWALGITCFPTSRLRVEELINSIGHDKVDFLYIMLIAIYHLVIHKS